MKSFKSHENQKTAVIYTRVSTDEQAEHGFSLSHQEDLLRKECARQGITVFEHFQDDGYSAKDFNRPAFKRLLDYLNRHKKQVAYLFVTKWCRFSRDVANSIIMRRELKQYGVQVKALSFMGNSDKYLRKEPKPNKSTHWRRMCQYCGLCQRKRKIPC